ncbi:NRDE family protein [Acidocella sp.]|uniref:NRDE family protein n=1 Tax=Acidocella sp. TaxID=50710 RepID=UPI003D06D76B
MCSIILHIGSDGVTIAANRDEMTDRLWDKPAEYWPGIHGGRDRLGGGTWAALNRHGVFAALLNRDGTLGPAPGKTSRGGLPLLALAHEQAGQAATYMATLNTRHYRSFNLVLADSQGAFLLHGQEHGLPALTPLSQGVTMITSGDPNDMNIPRIARHLPRFRAANPLEWPHLLADRDGSRAEQLNIPATPGGFGTICAMSVRLPRSAPPEYAFAAGPPDQASFHRIFWP